MIIAYIRGEKGLEKVDVPSPDAIPANAAWIDVVEITQVEERELERRYGLEIPTREEMQEIEQSSRLYREGAALFMTSTMLLHTETDVPERTVVTFILTKERLITLRYAEPWSFKAFCVRACKPLHGLGTTGEALFVGILETTIERLADVLEHIDAQLERASNSVFMSKARATEAAMVDLQEIIYTVGRAGNALGKARESLVDKHRLVAYAFTHANDWLDAESKTRLRTLSQDSQALADHASFIGNKVGFLLDATLGLINMDQNKILKIFSVVTVMFTPPILICGIYGMNFQFMPEKDWHFGYPLALLAMAVSGAIPYVIFRRRGWL